jgi:tetratricopeptide (TPR) repeat protein
MSDERLDAGRHHLRNGNRAFQQGYPAEARAFFESALLQFRGPELRVGEAHALRGLAQVELTAGDPDEAERLARAAIAAYEDLARLLDGVADAEAVADIRADANQGEAAARVVLAEALTRTGRVAAARAILDEARDLLDQQRDSLAAGAVWTALGRLALRAGNAEEALRWFDRALRTHEAAGDPESQIATLLLIAEQRRLGGALDAAGESLDQARRVARELEVEGWNARILCALGAVALQADRPLEARSYYEDAVQETRTSGEPDRLGAALVGLGSARARLGEAAALDVMIEGARALASVDHRSAVAGALHQIAGLARQRADARLALAAAEAARRLWATTEGPRGQVRALRHAVKALSGLRHGRGALVAALAREALAGDGDANAREVATWFRERAPAAILEAFAGKDADQLVVEARREIERALGEALIEHQAVPDDLGVPALAVELVAKLAAASAAPSAGAAAITIDALGPTETDSAPTPPVPRDRSPDAPPPRAAAPPPRAEDLYASLFGGDDD